MSEEPGEAVRPVPARIGIAALNLPVPGLGLLRVQRPKAALVLLLVPTLLFGGMIGLFATLPTLGFRTWLGILLVPLAVMLIVYVTAIVMSWRASRVARRPGPWWSRWYGIAAVFAAVVATDWLATEILRGYYGAFYIASESMAPTLVKGDRFVASLSGPGALRRGDIILFDAGRGATRVMRIAALPGDRIEMVDGIVVLNGRAVERRFVRSDPVAASSDPAQTAIRLSEQFPGEAAPHEIYDTGPSIGDDMAAQAVAPGHVFVLGDNRDNSADSRFNRRDFGVAQLPIAAIRGRPLFHSWGSRRPAGEATPH